MLVSAGFCSAFTITCLSTERVTEFAAGFGNIFIEFCCMAEQSVTWTVMNVSLLHPQVLLTRTLINPELGVNPKILAQLK